MAVYAIGDVQGCYRSLRALLHRIRFDPENDQLWFVGDLVNRGPDSLQVLRFVKALGDRAKVVLGNHDLNLLAVAAGARARARRDTLNPVLQADDCDELLTWLRSCPLFIEDSVLNVAIVHAGLIPQWTCTRAAELAGEVEDALRSDHRETFLHRMYGDTPRRWRDSLAGWDRLRFITNVFTRMRYCDRDGRIDLAYTGLPGTQPATLKPWYAWRHNGDELLIFGHWSTLGAAQIGNVICLDSGCVWGNSLTAARLDKRPVELTAMPCQETEPVPG